MCRMVFFAAATFLAPGFLGVAAAQESARGEGAGTETSQTEQLRYVPKLQGRRLVVARQIARLARLRFAEGVFYIAPHNWRDDVRPGLVYMQSPQPRGLIREGGTIACWTFLKASEDQEVVKMPDLRRKTQTEAAQRLDDLGLEAMTASPARPDADHAVDDRSRVLEHYPEAGQPVYVGTSVYLRLGAARTTSGR